MNIESLLEQLRNIFGDRLKEQEPLARYTSARIGGPAEALLSVSSKEELVLVMQKLWESDVPYRLLGGGSNILVSDAGVPGVVVLNQARKVHFTNSHTPSVWAESGAHLSKVARQAGKRGLGGLEWAAGIPGTVGGAVVGNAGAHGGEISSSLILAEILHCNEGQQFWEPPRFEFGYRSSLFKRQPRQGVVLTAQLRLEHKSVEEVEATMQEFDEHRRRTQPRGPSMGSMFKNPPGDSAGRLIDAAGLKGTRVGDAEISEVHANFFINRGKATAADVWSLIQLARQKIKEQFGVRLELEIELIGVWDEEQKQL
ncbi:MAG: UDP-N-acetylmuramate dehydrogenase [Chloroflexota bacterium]